MNDILLYRGVIIVWKDSPVSDINNGMHILPSGQ